jgi:hypothetical protein
MKTPRTLTLVLTLLMSLMLFPQISMPNPLIDVSAQRNQSNTVAMEAWPSYFAALRAAVQKRDRAALSKMMSRQFRYDCCDNPDDNGNGETRDEAFKTWNRLPKQGWAALDRLLGQGVVPASAEWSSNNGRSKPNLIAPRNANRRSYSGPIADFEWRDGRWYFVSFQFSE